MRDKYGIDKEQLKQAVELAGGQLALSRKIGYSQQDISRWVNSPARYVPASAIIPICEAISWKKTPHQIAPCIYPNAEDGLPPAILRLRVEAA